MYKGTFFFLCAIITLAACTPSARLPRLAAEDMQNQSPDISDKLFTLNDRTKVDNVNGTYPESITVKSLTQTFCKGYQFMIRSGKIWMKEDGDEQWSILLKTGLPFSKKSQTIPNSGWFKSPDSIVEIAADGDCLFAFDDKGLMYNLYTQNSTSEKPFTWISVFGWPNKVPLTQNNQLVQNKRGWGMGVRRKDILWYEDRFGNQHHYGTMGLETLYFLTENGQEIRFTDSGLPVDFSRSILSPERGSFIARNISVSGDTIFLIADDGTMYTRLIDFDTMGCDPMFFKYTYTAEKQSYAGSDYRSNFTPWGLPNEGWKKQQPVALTGFARLSRFISISQNGQGNNARELRVAGIDKNGTYGYYHKGIADENWKFDKAQIVIHDGDYLTGTYARGKKNEYSYGGYLLEGTTPVQNITCSIQDFTLTSEGSCTLTISKKINNNAGHNAEKTLVETKKIPLDLVEMWTYMVRTNPGFDGTPRHFFATAILPQALSPSSAGSASSSAAAQKDSIFSSADENFASLLRDLFGGKDKKLFAFTIEATDKYVQIDTTGESKKQYTFFLNTTNTIAPPEAYKSAVIFTAPIIAKYADSDLILEDKPFYTMDDMPAIKKVISNDADYIALLNNEIDRYDDYKVNTNVSRWGYNAVDLITTVTLLNQIDFPKIKTMTSFGDTLMNTNARNFRDMYEYRSFTYPHVIELVQTRIASYISLENALVNGMQKVYKDNRLHRTFPEYFDELHIPADLKGSSPSAKQNAQLEQISEVPMFPGFLLTVDGEHDKTQVFIELKDAARTIYDRSLLANAVKDLEDDPLEIDAVFIPLSNNTNILDTTAGVKFLSRKEGKLFWNGKTLTIKAYKKPFGNDTLFEGSIQ